VKLVIAITGASGSIYAQRLMHTLADSGQVEEAHLVFSSHAHEVADCEIDGYEVPDLFQIHDNRSMQVPFVSGSSKVESCVIVPCSMGTLGRIAYGYSDSVITRTADVFMKERRNLIIVPRETPWNLIQARNVVSVIEAGAMVLPAIPSFYGRPQTITDAADTVVARILDHLGVEHDLVKRWKEC